MEYRDIDDYINEHMDELLHDLETLVNINSEFVEPAPNAPFGQGAADCIQAAEKIAARCGFTTRNYDNYAISADFSSVLPPVLDILAHLDVVPAGNGWSVTEPFKMKIVNGKAYGRGTIDDKGPAICALYAMRAVRECGYELKGNARLILGSDEECGSRDLEHYFESEKSAPLSISPDADFPVINIEKGGLHSGFTSDAAQANGLPRLISINAGVKINVVPDRATALIEGLSRSEAKAALAGIPGMDCEFEFCDSADGLSVTVKGQTAHASTPESGKNALTALLAFIAALPLCPSPLHAQLKAVHGLFPHGDFNGAALGVALKDDVSGCTTLTLDMLSYSGDKGLSGMFDCRACLSANDENTTDVIYDKFRASGLTPMDRTMYAPHHVQEDSALVQTLMGLYNSMTGQAHKPICIGGGTYVHDIENGVGFGCCTEDIDNHMHGADEFMTLEQISFAARIYARAIIALCGAENNSGRI